MASEKIDNNDISRDDEIASTDDFVDPNDPAWLTRRINEYTYLMEFNSQEMVSSFFRMLSYSCKIKKLIKKLEAQKISDAQRLSDEYSDACTRSWLRISQLLSIIDLRHRKELDSARERKKEFPCLYLHNGNSTKNLNS